MSDSVVWIGVSSKRSGWLEELGRGVDANVDKPCSVDGAADEAE